MNLTPQECHSIQQAMAQVPHIEQAVLFGSRALGTARPGSDVDIAIMGAKSSLQDALRATSLLEESTLPYAFDIINFNSITHEALREHILQHGQVLYTITPPSGR